MNGLKTCRTARPQMPIDPYSIVFGPVTISPSLSIVIPMTDDVPPAEDKENGYHG